MENNASALQDFVSLVRRNLEKNGFPDAIVSFPLEKMYESASQRGFSFNKVRDILQEQGIQTELTESRVVFSQLPDAEAEPEFDMLELQKAAQSILQHLTPEQREEMNRMMQSMSSEDLDQMRQQWESMPGDEKARRMAEFQKLNQQP